MKTFFLLLMCLCFLVGCVKSPEKFAEEALTEMGSGTYAGIFDRLEKFKTLAHRGEIHNSHTKHKTNDSNLDNIMINTDVLFSEFKIVKKEESKISLNAFHGVFSDLDTHEKLKDAVRKEKGYKEYDGGCYSYEQYTNIPCYTYKVNIDNIFYKLRIVDIPDVGYRVTFFMKDSFQ